MGLIPFVAQSALVNRHHGGLSRPLLFPSRDALQKYYTRTSHVLGTKHMAQENSDEEWMAPSNPQSRKTENFGAEVEPEEVVAKLR